MKLIYYYDFIISLPLSLPLLFTIIFLYKWLNKTNKKTNLPPSPPRVPILGNLHQLKKPPHRSLKSLSSKYGELMLLRLGSKPTLVVSSASAARVILQTHDSVFSNRPKLTTAVKLFYNGRDVVFTNYGDYWKQMKKICTEQLLNTARVRSFGAIREEETALMLENIMRFSPTALNLTEIIANVTNNVVCRAAFGRKYGKERCRNFNILLNRVVELLGAFVVGDFIPWLGFIDKLNGLEGNVDKLAKELDVFLEGVIQDHLHCQKSNGDKGEKTKDFVDILLQLQRDNTLGFPIERECIKALILDIFAGGIETTSTLMEWAMSELLRHPKALKELQEEVRTISQSVGGVREDELVKMEYLKAVIKESLRLHPSAPLLMYHETTKDVRVNGYDIAFRTQVIINAWAVQRDPSLWEEPDEFRPGRFLNSKVDFKGQDLHLIPFGAGRRICPGITFATINIELVLANLVYAFDWALPGGVKSETLDMSESDGMAVRRRHPLLAVATPYRC